MSNDKMRQEKIELLRMLREAGYPATEAVEAISTYGTSGQKATPAEEKTVTATPRDLEMYVRGLTIGATTTSYQIAAALFGSVPEGKGPKKSWTRRVMDVPGLETVVGMDGMPQRRKTPWGNTLVLQRVKLLSDSSCQR